MALAVGIVAAVTVASLRNIDGDLRLFRATARRLLGARAQPRRRVLPFRG